MIKGYGHSKTRTAEQEGPITVGSDNIHAIEDKRDPRTEEIPGRINPDGKPIIELLDEAFGPVQEDEPARRRTIGELYTQKKSIDEIGQLRSLSPQFGIPFLAELPTDHMNVEFTRKIPIQYLKKHKMVPLETPEACLIAVNDPSNFQAVDDLRRILGRHDAEVVLASEGSILSTISYAYDMGRDSTEEFTEIMNGESADNIISEIEETADLLDEASDAPIIKLVNLVLAQAIKDRASDIHIEPYANALKIRYRIDGMLYNLLNLPRRIQSSLVSRIKIMAKLNIAEKRLPQDGRIEVKIGDKSVDIRVSVIPTAFGERVVLRLLDKSQALLTLSDLGLGRQRRSSCSTGSSSRPTASSSSPGPRAAARRRRSTRLCPRSTAPRSTSSPSRTPSSTRSRGSARSRSTPRSTSPSPPACAPSCARTRTSSWWARSATARRPRSPSRPR